MGFFFLHPQSSGNWTACWIVCGEGINRELHAETHSWRSACQKWVAQRLASLSVHEKALNSFYISPPVFHLSSSLIQCLLAQLLLSLLSTSVSSFTACHKLVLLRPWRLQFGRDMGPSHRKQSTHPAPSPPASHMLVTAAASRLPGTRHSAYLTQAALPLIGFCMKQRAFNVKFCIKVKHFNWLKIWRN